MPLLSPTLSDSSFIHSHADRQTGHSPPNPTAQFQKITLVSPNLKHNNNTNTKVPNPSTPNTHRPRLQQKQNQKKKKKRSDYGHSQCGMAPCCLLLGRIQPKMLPGCPHSFFQQVAGHSYLNTSIYVGFRFPARRNETQNLRSLGSRVCYSLEVSPPTIELPPSNALMSDNPFCGQKVTDTISSKHAEMQNATEALMKSLMIIDLDPATAKVAIAILGPFLSAFAFLFILRIIMSWYPKLPVEKFPYIIAYAPTEPLLIPTRRLIPPLGGVDVTPVVWFGLISFLNEILVGPQGLLVLLSQQIS